MRAPEPVRAATQVFDPPAPALMELTRKLKEAFEAAKVPAEIEVYSMAQHGWCVPDMPPQANGQPIYKMDDAERAWGKLMALYKAGLV